MRRWCLALFLFVQTFAVAAPVAFTAHLQDVSTNPARSYLVLTLKATGNCTFNAPEGTIGKVRKPVYPDAAGNIAFSITPNSEILCANLADSTYYTIEVWEAASAGRPDTKISQADYIVVGDFDLKTAAVMAGPLPLKVGTVVTSPTAGTIGHCVKYVGAHEIGPMTCPTGGGTGGSAGVSTFNGLDGDVTYAPAWAEITSKPATFAPSAHTHVKAQITDFPTSWDWANITSKPTIPAAQVNSDWNAVSGLAQILNKPSLFDGTWASLSGKPTTFTPAAHTHVLADLPNCGSDGQIYKRVSGVMTCASDATGAGGTAGVSSFNGSTGDVSYAPAWADISGKPALFDGTYAALSGKPTIPAAQVNSDWNAVSGLAQILNKPSLFDGTWASLSGKPTLFDGTWSSLTGKPTLATVATSGSYTDLLDKPSIPAAQVQTDWNAVAGLGVLLNKPTLFDGQYASLTGKPTLFDGTYAALTGKPTIPAAQVNSDWNAVSGLAQILNKPSLFDGTWASLTGKPATWAWASLTGVPEFATVATSGSYNDLANKPTIPAAQVNADWNAVAGAELILNKPSLFDGTWASLSGKPATFAPTAHASTHTSAGSDPVTIAESQVTNLATDLAAKLDVTTAASTYKPKASAWAVGTDPTSTTPATTGLVLFDRYIPTFSPAVTVTIPSGCSGSYLKAAGVLGTVTFALAKNGATICTFTFTSGGTSATPSGSGGTLTSADHLTLTMGTTDGGINSIASGIAGSQAQ